MVDFNKYASHKPTRKPNKLKIPVNNFGFNDSDIKEFNNIYKYCLALADADEIKDFQCTASKGISTVAHKNRGARWKLTVKPTFCEILLKHPDTACYYRWIIGYGKDKSTGLGGRRSFQLYCRCLLEHGVNIEDFAIENGLEVKETIPAPRIECKVAFKRTYSNAHHIDLNSAYNAGMMYAFPALEPAIRHMYNMRKKQAYFKEVLAMTQGFMQSELVGYKYAHISKAGYVYTNARLEELTEKLEQSGRRILGYNTDGIWYQGEIYHDEGEGTDIGQWKHDYTNVDIRYKSHGCYEIQWVDSDGYHYKPVFRGNSSLEKIKPREQWEWGDILNGSEIKYAFIPGVGVVKDDAID